MTKRFLANLKPGMLLGRDLLSREGSPLLSADYILGGRLISQIQDYARRENYVIMSCNRVDRHKNETAMSRFIAQPWNNCKLAPSVSQVPADQAGLTMSASSAEEIEPKRLEAAERCIT